MHLSWEKKRKRKREQVQNSIPRLEEARQQRMSSHITLSNEDLQESIEKSANNVLTLLFLLFDVSPWYV